MKRKRRTDTGLWTYLESSGALNGTEAEITRARNQFVRDYKTKWRKEKRRKEKEFTPSFNREEVKILSEAAHKHKMSITKYIRTSALAYTDNIFIVPNQLEVRRISQLLAMVYNLLQEMMESKRILPYTVNTLLKKVQEIEREVLVHLCNPATLQEWIKKEMRNDPEIKDRILELLTAIP